MKKKIGKNIIGFIVAVILLISSGLLGSYTGVFDSFEEGLSSFHYSPDTILKTVIAICFLYALKCVVNVVMGQIKGRTARARTLTTIIASVIKYTIFLAGMCWILTIIGVNVSTIFASIGVIALIVGFGAESLVADVVTGIFILFENQFNVGDIIEVDGFRGTVDNITIRTISIRDPGGNVKIINNSNLSNVINRSDHGSVAISQVGVSYDTDLEAFDEIVGPMLNEIKEKHPDIFIGDVAYLGVESLADSSVVLKFKADVTEANVFSGMRLLNKELKCALDKRNITIAFPQLDVHTK